MTALAPPPSPTLSSLQVLILDVARFKYPPHWVPAETLWEAMRAVDPEAGEPRGYLSLRPAAARPAAAEAAAAAAAAAAQRREAELSALGKGLEAREAATAELQRQAEARRSRSPPPARLCSAKRI